MLWKDMNQSSIASYLILPAGGCLHSHRVSYTRVIKSNFCRCWAWAGWDSQQIECLLLLEDQYD